MRTIHYTEVGGLLAPPCADAGGFVTFNPETAELIKRTLISGDEESIERLLYETSAADRWVGAKLAFIEIWRSDES